MIEVWKTGSRWYWRHVAGNGQVDGGGEQGYRSKWYTKRKARRAFPGTEVQEVLH